MLEESFPEHAKMYAFTAENWAIRGFMTFLAGQGLSELTYQQTEDVLLAWRGVDRLAYEAEAAQLESSYRWLWSQFNIPTEPGVRHPAVLVPAVVRMVEAALPPTGTDDGLAFLLDKIRGGKGEYRNQN